MAGRIDVFQRQLSPYCKIESQYEAEMAQTVVKMTARGKGLLAADESIGSVDKRFKGIKLQNNAGNRLKYRALMIGAEGIEKYISGVIFHEETLTQKFNEHCTFAQYCTKLGIVPGIKTDKGVCDLLHGAPGEQSTDGLDGYVKRAQGYYQHGARFCKWRCVYKIQNNTVSDALIHFNAETLARYAALSQVAGLVPIVEPEVMIDGTHSIETCSAVSKRVWSAVVTALHRHGVILECMLLKPNMVVPGAESGRKGIPEEVARFTVSALSHTLPAAVRGVTFLSGGLSEVDATAFLNAMNQANVGPRPWNLTFSYARALQSSALQAWGGKDENFPAARRVFLHRAKMNSLAHVGQYNREEDVKQSESLYVKGHSY